MTKTALYNTARLKWAVMLCALLATPGWGAATLDATEKSQAAGPAQCEKSAGECLPWSECPSGASSCWYFDRVELDQVPDVACLDVSMCMIMDDLWANYVSHVFSPASTAPPGVTYELNFWDFVNPIPPCNSGGGRTLYLDMTFDETAEDGDFNIIVVFTHNNYYDPYDVWEATVTYSGTIDISEERLLIVAKSMTTSNRHQSVCITHPDSPYYDDQASLPCEEVIRAEMDAGILELFMRKDEQEARYDLNLFSESGSQPLTVEEVELTLWGGLPDPAFCLRESLGDPGCPYQQNLSDSPLPVFNPANPDAEGRHLYLEIGTNPDYQVEPGPPYQARFEVTSATPEQDYLFVIEGVVSDQNLTDVLGLEYDRPPWEDVLVSSTLELEGVFPQQVRQLKFRLTNTDEERPFRGGIFVENLEGPSSYGFSYEGGILGGISLEPNSSDTFFLKLSTSDEVGTLYRAKVTIGNEGGPFVFFVEATTEEGLTVEALNENGAVIYPVVNNGTFLANNATPDGWVANNFRITNNTSETIELATPTYVQGGDVTCGSLRQGALVGIPGSLYATPPAYFSMEALALKCLCPIQATVAFDYKIADGVWQTYQFQYANTDLSCTLTFSDFDNPGQSLTSGDQVAVQTTEPPGGGSPVVKTILVENQDLPESPTVEFTITSAGDGFSVTPQSLTVAPGETGEVEVQFDPPAYGDTEGSLTMTMVAPGWSTFELTLLGQCLVELVGDGNDSMCIDHYASTFEIGMVADPGAMDTYQCCGSLHPWEYNLTDPATPMHEAANGEPGYACRYTGCVNNGNYDLAGDGYECCSGLELYSVTGQCLYPLVGDSDLDWCIDHVTSTGELGMIDDPAASDTYQCCGSLYAWEYDLKDPATATHVAANGEPGYACRYAGCVTEGNYDIENDGYECCEGLAPHPETGQCLTPMVGDDNFNWCIDHWASTHEVGMVDDPSAPDTHECCGSFHPWEYNLTQPATPEHVAVNGEPGYVCRYTACVTEGWYDIAGDGYACCSGLAPDPATGQCIDAMVGDDNLNWCIDHYASTGEIGMKNDPATSGTYQACSGFSPWDYDAGTPAMSLYVAANGQPGYAAHYTTCVPEGQYDRTGDAYACCTGTARHPTTGQCLDPLVGDTNLNWCIDHNASTGEIGMKNDPATSGTYQVCSGLSPWIYNAGTPAMSLYVASNGQPGYAAHYTTCVPEGQYDRTGDAYACCAGTTRNPATGQCLDPLVGDANLNWCIDHNASTGEIGMINDPAASGTYQACSGFSPWIYDAGTPAMSLYVAANGQPGYAAHYTTCVPAGQYDRTGDAYGCCAGLVRNPSTGQCL